MISNLYTGNIFERILRPYIAVRQDVTPDRDWTVIAYSGAAVFGACFWTMLSLFIYAIIC